MKIMKKITKEFETEEIDKQLCDNCENEIKYPHSCGHGAEYNLSDAWCKQCGGKSWDFCSLKCLQEFVNNKLEKDTEVAGDAPE